MAIPGIIPCHGGVVGDSLVLAAEPDEARHHLVDALVAEKLPKLYCAVEFVLVGSLSVCLDG